MTTPTQTAPKLDFVIFYVSDLEASLNMFKKMGFTHVPSEDTPVYRQLRGAEGSMDFGIVQTNEHAPPAGTTRIYYKVDDLQHTHTNYADNGLEPSPIIELPFGKTFEVATPDNLNVSLL